MRAIGVSAYGHKRPSDVRRRSGFQPRSAGQLFSNTSPSISPCRSPPCGRSMCQLSARSGHDTGLPHLGILRMIALIELASEHDKSNPPNDRCGP